MHTNLGAPEKSPQSAKSSWAGAAGVAKGLNGAADGAAAAAGKDEAWVGKRPGGDRRANGDEVAAPEGGARE